MMKSHLVVSKLGCCNAAGGSDPHHPLESTSIFSSMPPAFSSSYQMINGQHLYSLFLP